VTNIESSSAGPPALKPRVVLFSRSGCHLCDAARAVVEKVTADLGERYVERDITADPGDLSAYGDSIPVVEVDGVQVDFWRISEDRLRTALRP
jgi:hypothetical protein